MILVIDKALDILEYIAQDKERSFILSEIAEALNLNQATCANILKTLTARNYVEHVGKRKGYRLGPMAYTLTSDLAQGTSLLLAAKDIMEQLTRQLGETSLLAIIRNYKRFALHSVHSDQDLQARSRSEREIYDTASGRLLLAYMNAKEKENFLANRGLPTADIWQEASTREGLETMLTEIRTNALCIVHTKTHIIGLAVPITKQEKVIAALGVFLPEIRCTAQRQQEIIQALRSAAHTIEQRLEMHK